jgi:uncharacterized Zn-finger protein
MAQTPPPTPSPDTIRVEENVVACDGTNPQGKSEVNRLGHPMVYLNMGEEGQVTCPYCSRHFVLVEYFETKE